MLCSVIPRHDFLFVLWTSETHSSFDAPAAVQSRYLDTDGLQRPSLPAVESRMNSLLLGHRAEQACGDPHLRGGHLCLCQRVPFAKSCKRAE